MFLLDDLLWVLTDSQLKAMMKYAESLSEAMEKLPSRERARAPEPVQVRGGSGGPWWWWGGGRRPGLHRRRRSLVALSSVYLGECVIRFCVCIGSACAFIRLFCSLGASSVLWCTVLATGRPPVPDPGTLLPSNMDHKQVITIWCDKCCSRGRHCAMRAQRRGVLGGTRALGKTSWRRRW